jgi:hypothetical protein
MNTHKLSGYNGPPLPGVVETFLTKLWEHGVVSEVTRTPGKTIAIIDSGIRRGYINSIVLRKGGVLGYGFNAWGHDGGACPQEFVDTLVPTFCSRYNCDPSDLIVYQEGRNNSPQTFLFIVTPWEG